jgi:hypothetical protein
VGPYCHYGKPGDATHGATAHGKLVLTSQQDLGMKWGADFHAPLATVPAVLCDKALPCTIGSA